MALNFQQPPAPLVPPAPDLSPSALNGDGQASLSRRLLQSLGVIQAGQHPNGEILSFRRDREGNYQYCRSPFASAWVHDLLSCFDPSSSFFDEGCLMLVPDRETTAFTTVVSGIRRRVRSFLAWQEEPPGWWRFLGRRSSLDPDVDTTTHAAIALMDQAQGPGPARDAQRRQAVERFCSPSGWYYTFLNPKNGGYGWMDEVGRPVVGFDRVVNAHCLRYLALLGLAGQAHAQQLADHLLEQAAHADLAHGTALYPSPLEFPFTLARAWRQGALSNLATLQAMLLPRVLAFQEESGSFGGPVSTAMGVLALVDLGFQGAALRRATSALVRQMKLSGGWSYEDFVVSGFGSPALSSAFGLSALARSAAAGGNWL